MDLHCVHLPQRRGLRHMRNVLEGQGADSARAEEKRNVHQHETRENRRERVCPPS